MTASDTSSSGSYPYVMSSDTTSSDAGSDWVWDLKDGETVEGLLEKADETLRELTKIIEDKKNKKKVISIKSDTTWIWDLFCVIAKLSKPILLLALTALTTKNTTPISAYKWT